jgi:hypothetical protein
MSDAPCDRAGRRFAWALSLALTALATATDVQAACRVSDHLTRPLSSLGEVQRLSFVRQMTDTEYDRLKRAAPGSGDYEPLIAASASRPAAQQAAQAKLDAAHILNSDDYANIWASDFLDDAALRELVACSSMRRPGIIFAGRPDGPGTFNLSFAHLTPIGIEKIRIRVVASRNVANIADFEAFLNGLGEQDNFKAQTFALTRVRPEEQAVLVLRAGWETPLFIYIPTYPAPAAR